MILPNIISDFLSLFYPKLCLLCKTNLLKKESCLCTSCLYKLPKTDCFNQRENKVSQLFWGRVKIINAAALFQFSKGGSVQELMRQLKYDGNKKVGVFLGEELAYALQDSNYFKNITLIVPVPLHPKKQKLRGYNQCHSIAKGLKQVLQIPINKTALIRTENTDSQTRKKRYSRWENMANSFMVCHSGDFMNQHILLVDDVITTGSTLEACAQKLLEIEGVTVSIVATTIA